MGSVERYLTNIKKSDFIGAVSLYLITSSVKRNNEKVSLLR
jgi:hypothetical protein